nr:hypothetical protein [Micromonospora sp. DSM 115978]
MAEILFSVQSRPGHPKSQHLTISEDAVTIDEAWFRWAEIDRIAYTATVFLAMGFDQGAAFSIQVGASAREARFMMQCKGSGALRNDKLRAQREEQQTAYALVVTVLESNVGERLVAETVRALRRGESVEIGGLRLDRHGMHRKGLFGGEKSARWSSIDSLNVFDGALNIWAGGNERKPALTTGQGAWNAVLLPRIIGEMGGPPPA